MPSQSPQLQHAPWSVAIAGAGLSGLCLAQGLLQAGGFDVHVYERDPSLDVRRQGYRITLDRFGAAALKRCLPPHLFELVLATASPPEDVGYFRFTNEYLGEIFKLTFKRDPQSTAAEPLGQVDRATLRSILLSGLEERVHFSKAAIRVEMRSTDAVLHFADGDATRAALVVGADGVHSALREHLLPDCPPLDTGYRGIYGKTPLFHNGTSLVPESLEHSGVFAIGASGHGFFFTTMRFHEPPQAAFARLAPDRQAPIDQDYVMWAVLFPPPAVPASVWGGGPSALHARACEAARVFHPVLQRFVERADVDFTVAVTLNAASRPKRWPASRATLMGDAVHVMPPTGAHGGNTALRDAALLAETLQDTARRGERLEHAIKTYQEEMLAYAVKEVASSTAMLRRSSMRNPLVRFAMLRAVPWVRSLGGSSLVLTLHAG
jgi:2-polyprenyl-6-methoxyphenol hydroxylase-like FAD-dependent oxidoreductase